ncbi:cobalamin B12-binding domain-containing protein [Sutcliffiella rhizosphaerae]|uniref:B12-binding domain-containing protein n=1 Tax=Sutcliffiella rhizosphaerae TaxID=2880967 RepID=A0ABN8ACT5_9BACI|nr:cobalamin B12-binding domain-containing protein [Sutcliffiella rhizosphaerae]CAG9620500.1 hypothetical protein BACCIP111883_01269 [Sutcliffiella rhizosphaerae]
MNEISMKLSQYLLKKDVVSSWSNVHSFLNQGKNSGFIYDNLFRNAMYQVGDLWEQNTITVADEHLATATCELVLAKYHMEKVSNCLNKHKIPPRALFFCVEGEEHNLGLKMAASLFEEFGWDVYDLGSNLPVDYAEYSIKKWNPEVVCISISVRHHLSKLQETLQRLEKVNPALTIIVGSRFHQEESFLSCCTPGTLIAQDATFLFEWLENYQKETGRVDKGVLL